MLYYSLGDIECQEVPDPSDPGSMKIDCNENGNGNGTSPGLPVSCSPPCFAAVIGFNGIECKPRTDTQSCLKEYQGKTQPCEPCSVLVGTQCGRAANYDECMKAFSGSNGNGNRGNNPGTGFFDCIGRIGTEPLGDECSKKLLIAGGIIVLAGIVLWQLS
jgi:hypothetical protein